MRYFIGLFIALGLITFIFVLLLGGGGRPSKVKPELISYANTGTTVQLTIDGSVSAPQTHRQVQITIGGNKSTLEVLKGYQGQVIRSKSYANDPTSYAVFLRALDLAGYTKGNDDPKKADDRGYCPLGARYIFEINEVGNQVERYWTSSCKGGTFKGKTQLIITLFEKQIPDYSKLISNVNFF